MCQSSKYKVEHCTKEEEEEEEEQEQEQEQQ